MSTELTILIDDDSLVRMSWKMVAKSAGVSLQAFSTFDEFLAKRSEFDLSTPIYVDVSLANGVSGVDVVHQLKDLGFTHIYLATGYSPEEFKHLTFLKGVVGKDAPWV